MTEPVPTFFGHLNVGATGASEAPFLNFGYVDVDDHGRPRTGRGSPTASSLALLRQVVADLDLDGRRVVEIGCGRGGNLRWLSRHRRPAALVGIDLTPSSTRASVDLVGVERLGAVTADAEALPVAAGSADVVLNIESSCLYPDLTRFYAEVARVLRSGGHFAYADVLPRPLVAELPHLLAGSGLEVTGLRDITANVVASVATREAVADGPAREVLAWFHERFTGPDLAYLCVRARRTATTPAEPPPLSPAATEAVARLADFVAEALRRADGAARAPRHPPVA